MDILNRSPFLLTAAVLFAFLLPPPLPAQSPETQAKFAAGPHTGKIEEALVGVEVLHTAESMPPIRRRGNGYVLRCDGFVLIPAALLRPPAATQAAKYYPSKITITLHPGSEQERRVPVALPRVMSPRAGYAVVKMSDVHSAAVETLLPDTLKADDALEVAWSDWNETTQRFGPVQRHTVRLKRTPETGMNASADMALLELPGGMPVGAAVIGPEERAVGMITATGAQARADSLETLDIVTNCVTPQSVPDAIFEKRKAALAKLLPLIEADTPLPREINRDEKTEEAKAHAPGMVPVKGSPVRLSAALVASQQDMGNASAACVAPFLIDKYEVTNQQYLAFWESLPESKRRNVRVREALFPLSWADTAPYFPRDLAEKPVLGVTYQGAREYARWTGRRLPTPYEWSLAAFGPTGGTVLPDWAKRYIAQRQQVWKEVEEAHFRYVEQHAVLAAQFRILLSDQPYIGKDGKVVLNGVPTDIPVPEGFDRPFHLPWYFYRTANSPDARWSKETVMRAITPLMEEWKAPLTILSVGVRDFDVSPCGARDMILNAFEMVCPSPENRADTSTFYLRMRWHAPERDGIRRGAALLTWYEVLLQQEPMGDTYLLSRRLRSSTTNNLGGGENWSPANQEPRTIVASSIYEVAAMLFPISAGTVQLVPGNTRLMGLLHTPSDFPTSDPDPGVTRYDLIGPGQAAPFKRRYPNNPNQRTFEPADVQWYEAGSVWFWKDPPRFFEREMGRPVDVDAPEGKNTILEERGAHHRVVPNTYLLPGGFRCVR